MATLTVVASAAAMGSTTAVGAPSIGELRAQVAQIQAEVAAIDDQVEAAAEAYNGAVWRLGQIQVRIDQNRVTLRKATRNLKRAQRALGARLRSAYLQPPPTRLQLILASGSVSTVLGGVQALERAGAQDATIVRGVQALRSRTIETRRELVHDRSLAKDEVSSRARQRDVVTGLLRRRQAVLSGAKGRLGAMLAAQRAREAREAAAARQRALERSRGSASPSFVPAGSGAVVSGAGSASNAQAARVALRYLGVPYRWGGASPSGFDCSGLASYAYAQVGKSVPHYTGAIWAAFPRVAGSLQPGDLVFFRGLGHMGIYIGGGQMVHAPHTGDVVRVASMSSRGDYVGAVRP